MIYVLIILFGAMSVVLLVLGLLHLGLRLLR